MFAHFKKSFRELWTPPQKQIPVLDGIRALAILLVVGLHCNTHILRAGLEKAWFGDFPPFRGGWVGVPLFFILSGFFIGTQLWREFLKTQTIDIKRFVLRRGLRIWPLYYFVLVSVLIIFPEHSQTLWSNVFFMANYLGDGGPVRGAWSLATEEQFYFVIPTLIFVMARFFGFRTLGQYRKLLFFLLFLPILNRGITWYLLTGFESFDIKLYIYKIYRPFHTHFDGLIVGLLISNVLSDKTFEPPSWLRRHWSFLVGVLIISLAFKWLNKVLFNFSALAFIFGAFTWMVLHRRNVFSKFLELPIFYFLAKVSFGVYLIHHPVLWTMESFGWFESVFVNPEIYLLVTYGVTFVLSCGVSALTYVIVEAPFIQWRNRILQKRRPLKVQ